MHTNMFANANSSGEVYAAFNRDTVRDSKVIGRADFWVIVGLIGLTLNSIPTYIPFLTIAELHLLATLCIWFSVRTSLYYYIDQSNRNWTMHLIDWMHNLDRR